MGTRTTATVIVPDHASESESESDSENENKETKYQKYESVEHLEAFSLCGPPLDVALQWEPLSRARNGEKAYARTVIAPTHISLGLAFLTLAVVSSELILTI